MLPRQLQNCTTFRHKMRATAQHGALCTACVPQIRKGLVLVKGNVIFICTCSVCMHTSYRIHVCLSYLWVSRCLWVVNILCLNVVFAFSFVTLSPVCLFQVQQIDRVVEVVDEAVKGIYTLMMFQFEVNVSV